MIYESDKHLIPSNPVVIGRLRNNWRRRDVTVYATSDPTRVYTIGRPFEGGALIETIESKRDWERVLSLFPKTAVYD